MVSNDKIAGVGYSKIACLSMLHPSCPVDNSVDSVENFVGLCPQAVGEPVDRGWRSVVVVLVDDGLLPDCDGSSEGDPCEEDEDGTDEKELADGGDPTCLVHHVDDHGDGEGADG